MVLVLITPTAVPRSNKKDKYAHKAKFKTTINGQDFTADADERWACENFPWLGCSPAEATRFKLWSKSQLKDRPVVWE